MQLFFNIFHRHADVSHSFHQLSFPRKMWYLRHEYTTLVARQTRSTGAIFTFAPLEVNEPRRISSRLELFFTFAKIFLFFAKREGRENIFCAVFHEKWLEAGCSHWPSVPTPVFEERNITSSQWSVMDYFLCRQEAFLLHSPSPNVHNFPMSVWRRCFSHRSRQFWKSCYQYHLITICCQFWKSWYQSHLITILPRIVPCSYISTKSANFIGSAAC